MSRIFQSIVGKKSENVDYPIIWYTYKFDKEIKKHDKKIKEFLILLQDSLQNEGLQALLRREGTKKLSGTTSNVFEFRSIVKGFRFLFKFGWQLIKDNNNTYIKDEDIILYKYVPHDEISSGGKIVAQYSDILENLNNFQIEEVDNLQNVDANEEFEFKYLSNINNYSIIPNFNDEQREAINDDSTIVIIDGLAGTGKTNICIQKIFNECNKEECCKILYSTFSDKLMNGTREYIEDNYINVLKEINNNFTKYSSISEIDKELKPYNLEIISDYTLDKFRDENIEIINRLQNNIEYKFLIDLYNDTFQTNLKLFDFDEFAKKFKLIIKDDLYTNYDRKYSKKIQKEIIFKEVEGVLLGKSLSHTVAMISLNDYLEIRKNEKLSEKELKFIYKIGEQYLKFIEKSNEYIDKNVVAQKIFESDNLKEKYDIVILDEVQDFTEKELLAYKHLSKKMFVAGDALQMINPTYFSFQSLKNILGKHSFHELNKNYRNTSEINSVVKNLFEINKNIFGNHGFKIPLSNDDNHGSSIYYAQHSSFLRKLNELRADNYTIVVATKEELDYLEPISDKEILTISDIKGLEREIIIMYNVLTNHYSKLPDIVNTKNADSNSLKRYYFNLFYVGITRAQNHIVVIEEKDIPDFKEFFERNFEKLDENVDVSELPFELTVLGDDEYISRITEALHIRKFDIVTKYIDKINDVELRKIQETRYNIFKNLIEANYINSIDSCLNNNLIDDAIFIARKMNNFDLEEVLKSVNYNGKIDYEVCYKVLFNTESVEVKKLCRDILEKSREDLISKCNDTLQRLEELQWNK